ncbi:endonuclease/exonuclease/phosphatase family protein [Albibacterium profundi]|uniref:Endonuclease/exonuclease/phosphatase family protein n=1 Tax=Albibacterium profundi TaxID=3134906 RepID=A0ABV5CDY2_9SPHI
MKNIHLSLVLLVLFSLFSLEIIHAQEAKEKKILKVLTYNVHHANPPSKEGFIDLPAIAKVIKQSGADLVALQEIDVDTERSGKGINQAAELGRMTGMNHFFVKGINYEGGEYGIAILSRFKILEKDSLRLPMKDGVRGEPRVLALTTISPTKGKKIVFASTHLDLNPETRILQAEAITNYLKQLKYPAILGGDFNAIPGTAEIDIFDQYLTRSSVPNGFTIPVTNPQREIDFIMFKPKSRFKVHKHLIIDEQYASDHLPVYVEFLY